MKVIYNISNGKNEKTEKMEKQILNLILQMATEINRMETNMYCMDSATKGFSQLQRSIKRMRAYMASCGFEIVEMTGKPYNMGIIADVDFITDNSLKQGEQFIKQVNRPQVNFKGVMIQKANIIVAQNL